MTLKTPSRSVSSLALCMVLLLATTIGAQQLSKGGTEDGKTAHLVAEMIKQYHIKQQPIDDKTSEQLLTQFLKQVDPQKLYFLQSDVDSFSEYKTKLDDLIVAGNVEFPFMVYDVFMKRLDERIATAQQWVDADHDFTADESMVIDADKIPWAQNQADMKERWRKRIKYDLVSLKLQDKTLEQARKQLHKRYDVLKSTVHQTEASEKLETYLSALCHCFDPHSSYMSPETLEDFQIQMRLSLEGIGAALKTEDGYVTVAEIVPGGAAADDGRLKAGDKIIGVAQADGDFVDVIEMKLSKVVRFIRGKKGTKVRLKVELGNKDKDKKEVAVDPNVPVKPPEVKIYELTRKSVELKSSEVKGEIINSGDRLKNGTTRIGVMHIPSFYRDFSGAQDGTENFKSTARDCRAVLKKFKDQGGIDVLVVDLRSNGGGALKEAIDVTGLFIDQGPVVQIKEPDGAIKSHDDEETGVAYSGPMIVLCNRLSASASEIFAGAIRDYGRGIVIGDTTTHGKGTVQNVMPVPNRTFSFLGNKQQRGALKLTINQFYRVNGDSTQNRGVESDVVLPSIIDHMDLGESFLDNALAFDHIAEAKHADYTRVNSDLVSNLRKSSQARVAVDAKFQETQKEIERFLERKNRKVISLNEETLRKERKADKEQEKAEESLKDPSEKTGEGPIFPEGNYNDEVLRVTLDYLAALKAMKTAGK